ncbi:hypothetical protein BDW22DRAFT_1357782 [Trametopsis cervina]|nr:hypothetical protein BDW22DRAFT_1357782 [Trametopsis cervina]
MLSTSIAVPVDGEFVIVSGASAASPIVATLLLAVNDARLAIGKKPIGFINLVMSANCLAAYSPR